MSAVHFRDQRPRHLDIPRSEAAEYTNEEVLEALTLIYRTMLNAQTEPRYRESKRKYTQKIEHIAAQSNLVQKAILKSSEVNCQTFLRMPLKLLKKSYRLSEPRPGGMINQREMLSRLKDRLKIQESRLSSIRQQLETPSPNAPTPLEELQTKREKCLRRIERLTRWIEEIQQKDSNTEFENTLAPCRFFNGDSLSEDWLQMDPNERFLLQQKEP